MYLIGSVLAIIFLVLIAVFGLGLPILAAVLVYRDASKRLDCSPWLWALVAALAPCFIGVIVYLIIRKDYPLVGEVGQRNTYRQAESTYEQTPSGDEQDTQAQYSSAYEQPMPERKGMPTWGKALLIIGAVVVVICLIALVVGVIQLFTGYANYYDAFGDTFGSGGYHYDF